jgi:hypothetical protein
MGRAGLLEDELCPDMKIKQAATQDGKTRTTPALPNLRCVFE